MGSEYRLLAADGWERGPLLTSLESARATVIAFDIEEPDHAPHSIQSRDVGEWTDVNGV